MKKRQKLLRKVLQLIDDEVGIIDNAASSGASTKVAGYQIEALSRLRKKIEDVEL